MDNNNWLNESIARVFCTRDGETVNQIADLIAGSSGVGSELRDSSSGGGDS